MAEEKYAIVRVEGRCPVTREFNFGGCRSAYNCDTCESLYGDTKQQLINKVAQVMRRNHLGWCNIERISKEIIEFMGVK